MQTKTENEERLEYLFEDTRNEDGSYIITKMTDDVAKRMRGEVVIGNVKVCPHTDKSGKADGKGGDLINLKYLYTEENQDLALVCESCAEMTIIDIRMDQMENRAKVNAKTGMQIMSVATLGLYTYGALSDNMPDLVSTSRAAASYGPLLNPIYAWLKEAGYSLDNMLVESLIVDDALPGFEKDGVEYSLRVMLIPVDNLSAHLALNRDTTPNDKFIQIIFGDAANKLPGEEGYADTHGLSGSPLMVDNLDWFYRDTDTNTVSNDE